MAGALRDSGGFTAEDADSAVAIDRIQAVTGRQAAPKTASRVELRDQLLAAAVAVLEAEGDASRVSVRTTTKAAGVSPTALYLHLPDRDALVDAAVDLGFEAFNVSLLAAASAHGEALARVRAMGVAYLEFSERQPALYTALFSTRRPMGRLASAPADEPGHVHRDEAFAGLVAAVTAAAPEASPEEGRERALALWAALHGFATLRTIRPMRGWPAAEPYVERLLRANLRVAEE